MYVIEEQQSRSLLFAVTLGHTINNSKGHPLRTRLRKENVKMATHRKIVQQSRWGCGTRSKNGSAAFRSARHVELQASCGGMQRLSLGAKQGHLGSSKAPYTIKTGSRGGAYNTVLSKRETCIGLHAKCLSSTGATSSPERPVYSSPLGCGR